MDTHTIEIATKPGLQLSMLARHVPGETPDQTLRRFALTLSGKYMDGSFNRTTEGTRDLMMVLPIVMAEIADAIEDAAPAPRRPRLTPAMLASVPERKWWQKLIRFFIRWLP